MKKICVALLFGLILQLFANQASAQIPGSNVPEIKPAAPTKLPVKKKRRKKRRSLIKEEEYKGSGLNFKLTPALFWSTLGLEVEKPVSDNITLSLAGAYRLGSVETKTDREVTDASYGNQYMVELAGKYYFDKTPKGWYAMAQVNVSNMLFADGTSRPFSTFGPAKSQSDINQANPFLKPGAFRYGLGAGYQWIAIRRNLVANIGAGLQFYSDSKGTHANLYLMPSFGYIF